MTRPPMSAVSTRAPLRRASDDRLLLGVCAGVARSLELAPLAVRLLAVALAAVAAPLVLGLYVVLAAIMPRDDGRVLLGGAPADRRESLLGWSLVGLTLIWFAGEEFRLGGLVWPALSSFGVFAAAASALVLLALAQRRETVGVASSPTADASPAADEAPERDLAPREDLVPADQPGAELAPGDPARESGATADTAIDGDAVTMPHETAARPPAAPRPPKRGPSIAVLGFGALLIVGATVFLLVALGLTDPSAGAVAAALGAGAALAGAGAIAGAVTQRRGVFGLLALGVILAASAAGVALFETELDDGVGLRTERPLSASEIPDAYRLGAGELDIDLRDTELPPGPTTVRARVAAGELDVFVPAGVRVKSVGPTWVAGVEQVNHALAPGKKRGTAKQRAAQRRAEAARPVVRIDADVREGNAEVFRVGG